MEEYKYGPSSLGLVTFRSEHANLAPTEVIVLHPPHRKGCRRARNGYVADCGVPGYLLHEREMDYVFVVKGSILGVDSRNDSGMQGI